LCCINITFTLHGSYLIWIKFYFTYASLEMLLSRRKNSDWWIVYVYSLWRIFGRTTLAHFHTKPIRIFLPVNPIGVNTSHTRSLNRIKLNKKISLTVLWLIRFFVVLQVTKTRAGRYSLLTQHTFRHLTYRLQVIDTFNYVYCICTKQKTHQEGKYYST
jgi:hypothetical protein